MGPEPIEVLIISSEFSPSTSVPRTCSEKKQAYRHKSLMEYSVIGTEGMFLHKPGIILRLNLN